MRLLEQFSCFLLIASTAQGATPSQPGVRIYRRWHRWDDCIAHEVANFNPQYYETVPWRSLLSDCYEYFTDNNDPDERGWHEKMKEYARDEIEREDRTIARKGELYGVEWKKTDDQARADARDYLGDVLIQLKHLKSDEEATTPSTEELRHIYDQGIQRKKDNSTRNKALKKLKGALHGGGGAHEEYQPLR